LGCRLTELDRLADTALGLTPAIALENNAAGAAFKRLHHMYVVAYLERLDYFLARALETGNWDARSTALFSERRESLAPALAAEREWEQSSPAIDVTAFQKMFAPDVTPFSAKKEFYDASLMKLMRQCLAKGEANWPHLQQCIRADVARTEVNVENFERISAPPPRFPEDSESGVRDVDYVLDRDLNWFQSDLGKRAPSLRFMRGLMFTSAPRFSTDEKDTPWELKSVSEATDLSVRRLAAGHANIAAIIADAEEFNALQRFFRLALSGELGPRFPTASLASLANELGSRKIPAFHVPRWQKVDAGEISVAQKQILKEVVQKVSTGMPKTANRDEFLARANLCLAALADGGSPKSCHLESSESKRACANGSGDSDACLLAELGPKLNKRLIGLDLLKVVGASETRSLRTGELGISECPAVTY
jgi:hypothetical protein